jgi:DNA polymerase-3 subunit delta
MAALTYTEFQNQLAEKGQHWARFPVVLVHGDDLLSSRVKDELVVRLLEGESADLNLDVIDGQIDRIRDALASINTYSLLSARKVVVIANSRVFYSQRQKTDLLQKAREAAGRQRMDRAAGFLRDLLRLQGLKPEDVSTDASAETLLDGFTAEADGGWFRQAFQRLEDTGAGVGTGSDMHASLEEAIAGGFPSGHHLLITTDVVDRRRSLFKTIAAKGLVIDCSVPAAGGPSGRKDQDGIFLDVVSQQLAESGKSMGREARTLLLEKTGTDMGLLVGNLNRLIDFVGDRQTISVEDVAIQLKRTRQDPLYAFTNAVTDRDLAKALFFLDALMTSGGFDHPLPLLTAILNQIRKLLLVKDFTESQMGRSWKPSLSYPVFQKQVFPLLKDHEASLSEDTDAWRRTIDGDPDSKDGGGKSSRRKKSPASDLYFTRPAKSPYPVFKLFLKSDRFCREELVNALESLLDADGRIKSTGTDPRLVLERVILGICKGSPKPSAHPHFSSR